MDHRDPLPAVFYVVRALDMSCALEGSYAGCLWYYALKRADGGVQDTGSGGWFLVVVAHHLWRECWIVLCALVVWYGVVQNMVLHT